MSVGEETPSEKELTKKNHSITMLYDTTAITAISLCFFHLSHTAAIITPRGNNSLAVNDNSFTNNNISIHDANSLPFNPTTCKLVRSNPWRNLPILPSRPPDPRRPGDGYSLSLLESYGGDLGTTSSSRAVARRQNPPSPNADCEQIANFKFKEVSGYLRSTPQRLTEGNSHYWVVWATDIPTVGKVWRATDPQGDSYTKVYQSDSTRIGYFQLEGGLANDRMMFDLSCPLGRWLDGASGEIALFRVATRPPG